MTVTPKKAASTYTQAVSYGLKGRWKLSNFFLFRIRLLPIVIFFATLVLSVRVTSLFEHVTEFNLQPFKEAHAQNIPEKKGLKKKKGPAEFDPMNMTAAQYHAIRGMKQKHDQLLTREQSISEKEQILQALLKKMDTKVKELKVAKVELEKVFKKMDEEENANTKRLVKMIEGMKAVEASSVLSQIEFPILLEIMEKLKEKKASAILSVMEAEKAGYLITALAKRRKLFKKDDPSKSIMKG